MSSHEPLNKRRKRGDDEESTEIIAFGGPMYDKATARKMLKEVVLISEEAQGELTAFGELEDKDLHFDPDKLDILYYVDDGDFGGEQMTAMTYFAKKGDAKMCRYLISRGASTTKMDDEEGSFPMHEAAEEGHLDICKVLYENGASYHIWKEHSLYGWTPFHATVCNGHDEVVRWFVLQGVLCADANSEEIDEGRLLPPYQSLSSSYSYMYTRLVDWAKMVVQTHSAVVMFLGGTLPPAPDTVQSRTLQCLSGYPGVRQHIGDFVGLEVTKRKQLRILRNVVDTLPKLLVSS